MGPLPQLITPIPTKIIRRASVQGAQPLRDDGRVDVGGGAQRVPAVRGGLFQITVAQVSEGDVGLDYRLAADPPGLEALQRVVLRVRASSDDMYPAIRVAWATPESRALPVFSG